MLERINSIRKILENENIDALLVCTAHNIAYITGFSGFSTHEREGYLFLTQKGAYIITDARLSEGARTSTDSKNVTIIELSATNKLTTILQELIDSQNIHTVGFEEHLTFYEHTKFKKIKNIKLELVSELIETVREIKSDEEMDHIRNACNLTDKTFSHILTHIQEGMSEKDVAWEMEKYIREHGGTLAFPTIVAFGKNSAIPHHHTGTTKLEQNSIILLDFGAQVEGYCADMTRTVFFGTAPEKFKKIYEAVKVAQEKGFIETLKPFSGQDIDSASRDYIKKQGYPTIPHSVGHGIGLQVHELPHISVGFNTEILPNTPFTIEPGIYENGYGGVRIEDTVYFDGKEILPLTKSTKILTEI